MSTIEENTIELRIPSRSEYVSIARAMVTDLAQKMALSASAIEDVQVAVSEACANVVCHAYTASEICNSGILVRCTAMDGQLVMEVADDGCGFTEAVYRSRVNSDRDGGFGLLLIRSLMDHVSLHSSPDHGTIVRMIKQKNLARTTLVTPF
jgi:serine/threonine-protein kinase RsbW